MDQSLLEIAIQAAILGGILYLTRTLRNGNQVPGGPAAKADSEPVLSEDTLDQVEDLIAERLQRVEERHRKRVERAAEKAHKGPAPGAAILPDQGDDALTSAKLYGILHGKGD